MYLAKDLQNNFEGKTRTNYLDSRLEKQQDRNVIHFWRQPFQTFAL